MEFKDIENLKVAGFKGFVPVSVMKTTGIYSKDGAADMELDKAGVYMVVRDTTGAPFDCTAILNIIVYRFL